jgi:flagellar biosynthesis component FlhA
MTYVPQQLRTFKVRKTVLKYCLAVLCVVLSLCLALLAAITLRFAMSHSVFAWIGAVFFFLAWWIASIETQRDKS